jgi:hypothetical protein
MVLVTPHFGGIEGRLVRCLAACPGSRVEELALARCETFLAERVVSRWAGTSSHAFEESGTLQGVSERRGQVLRATVRVDNRRAGLVCLRQRATSGVSTRKIAPEILRDREANESARLSTDGDGRVDPVLTRRVIGEVGHSQPGSVDSEDGLDVIGMRQRRRSPVVERAPGRALGAFFAAASIGR